MDWNFNEEGMISSQLKKGGIDFNPAQMSMQVKKEGEDFKFNFNGQTIDAAQITGAQFFIRTMTPVTNLPLILGISSPSQNNYLAASKS